MFLREIYEYSVDADFCISMALLSFIHFSTIHSTCLEKAWVDVEKVVKKKMVKPLSGPDYNGNMFVRGAHEVEVRSVSEALAVLEKGQRARQVDLRHLVV